jgi:phytoene dehydrogenase-like protein
MSPKTYDAVVIGAGHNGLTAAAYLGAAGLRTLVLERREIVGGCCVTEEVMPGCRVSTASYIASMLQPRVIRDLDLRSHGLRMVDCDPAFRLSFNGQIARWFADPEKTATDIRRFSLRDATTFLHVQARLKKLTRYLQPFFLEPPPRIGADGVEGLRELLRVGRRFWSMSEWDIAELTGFLTGSLGEFLDRHFERSETRTLFLANSVYGKHGGPYQMGTAMGLLFHLLGGGEQNVQGFSGHVIGGMGAITQAMAAAARKRGVEITTSTPCCQSRSETRSRARCRSREWHRDTGQGRALQRGSKDDFPAAGGARCVAGGFSTRIRGIKMAGPSAKVNFVLDQEPILSGTAADALPAERAVFTCLDSLESAERCSDAAKYGELTEDLWVDCVVPSNVDDTLAPKGRHMLTCFVQFVPYQLREGTWDEKRELLGDHVLRKIARFAPNVPEAVVARKVYTPLDLERTFGITEGNIFHGDLTMENLFSMRPVAGWAQYRTPISGLYLCGAGAHPGGGVTGAPGYNAAHQVLRDIRRASLFSRARGSF